MCELLALAFNEPVTARISFRGFRHRGGQNPHGWGLAWFSDGKATVWKEPAAANTSQKASQLQTKEIYSSIFIGHVRYATCGAKSPENTHPFKQTFQNSDVVFAHNGTLHGLPQPERRKPQGETDSENAFCLLLDWMEKEGVSFSDFHRIEKWLQELNMMYGTMNLLFSDGNTLFAYRDQHGYKGLCFTYRKAPFPTVRLTDEDWNMDLAEEKKPSEKGFVIATNALTDERWDNLKEGRLLAIRGGEPVYGDLRS